MRYLFGKLHFLSGFFYQDCTWSHGCITFLSFTSKSGEGSLTLMDDLSCGFFPSSLPSFQENLSCCLLPFPSSLLLLQNSHRQSFTAFKSVWTRNTTRKELDWKNYFPFSSWSCFFSSFFSSSFKGSHCVIRSHSISICLFRHLFRMDVFSFLLLRPETS